MLSGGGGIISRRVRQYREFANGVNSSVFSSGLGFAGKTPLGVSVLTWKKRKLGVGN